MKTIASRTGLIVVWVCLGILGAALYGILNDQITVTLCPEYFSVFKREQFAPALEQMGLLNAPTRIQALLVGTLATWWFGLLVGVVLSIGGLPGRRPVLATRRYVRAGGGIMLFAFCVSVLLGSVAYIVEPFVKPLGDQWPFLRGIHSVRRAFVVGFWHNGAYLGGFSATIAALLRVRRQRISSKP